jgi:hypothetical protein
MSNRFGPDFLARRGYWQCCGEYLLPVETVCRHCGRDKAGGKTLPQVSAPDQPTPTPQSQQAARGTKRRWGIFRSRTEFMAAERLGPDVLYEAIRVRLATGAWYTPDFVDPGRRVAYEVKHARRDVWNSRKTQRRILRVASERLHELGIRLRLLIWDGEQWTEADI